MSGVPVFGRAVQREGTQASAYFLEHHKSSYVNSYFRKFVKVSIRQLCRVHGLMNV